MPITQNTQKNRSDTKETLKKHERKTPKYGKTQTCKI